MTNTELYETDFHAWTQETARLLRERAHPADCLDLTAVAEEIESVGGRDRREVVNRLRVLIMHLLKWQFQPEYHSPGWRATIKTQRRDLGDIFEQSPSLRGKLAEWIARAWNRAADEATGEMQLYRNPFPPECPFTPEQIMDENWMPDA